MHDVMKGMLVALLFLYVVSPINLCPGPVDDLIVILLGAAKCKSLENRKVEGR